MHNVEYRDGWRFYVEEFVGEGRSIYYLVIRMWARCVNTHELTMVSSRRWLLSPQMVESEIVQTCLAACLAAEEHETRERFKYKGVRIFNPHIDVNWLLNNKEQIRAG